MNFYVLKNRLFWMLIVLSFFSQSSFSLTMIVSSPFDSVNGSLRTVISLSSAGDSIKFNVPGTDTVVLKNEIFINSAKIISGINSATGKKIVIQVSSPGVSPYRVFRIGSGMGIPVDVHIRDAILRGGRLAHGNGGVIMALGDLSLENVVISDGVVDSGWGGGIYVDPGSLRINNSTIANNTAKFYQTDDISPICASGGGIFVYDGRMVITNSTIANNSTLAFSTLTNVSNTVSSTGGGIDFHKGYLLIENCTVINNSSNARTTEIRSSTAQVAGGGIYTNGGHLAIVHCTVINNSCSLGTIDEHQRLMENTSTCGGGVYIYKPQIGIVNSIIVGNSVTLGTSSHADDIYLWTHNTIIHGHALNSIVDSAWNFTLTNCLVHKPMQQIFGTATPVLADNGGPTQTILPPASSIATGVGIKAGIFQRDTIISGETVSIPKIAYFNGSDWIALDNAQPVPAGNDVTPIPLDQRGQNRSLPPYIGSVENTAALGVPVTISPLNGDDGTALNPTLKWLSSRNALSYRIQISTHSDFSVTASDDAGITDTVFGASGLLKGTKYYWRVNATYSGGTGNWCMPSCFTTLADSPDAPVICSPLSESTEVPVKTALVWHEALRATSYRVKVSQSSDFSTLLKDTSGITDTSFSPAGLAHNTRYYWCVCAINSGGASAWMQTAYFETTGPAPAIPVIIYPTSGALTSLTPTLKWDVSSGAITYRVQVSQESNFLFNQKDSTLITDTILVVNGLSSNIKYYWRVNATNKGGTSAWSIVQNFVTIPSTPDIPVICSPVSGASNQPLTTTLIWHSVTAESYRVQVSQNEDFSKLFKDTSGIIDTTMHLAGLANSSRYYWRVCAITIGGVGGWMSTANFSVTAELPMSTVLLSPGNGALMPTDSVCLVWKASDPSAIQYMIEVATDSAMSHLFFVDSTITDTTTSIKALSNSMVCWWHVRTKNAAGWGPFSQKRSFRISATAVLPKVTKFGEFRLSATSGVLAYCLAERCFVNLSIFDLKGKLIKSFINSIQNPGWYHIETPKLNLSRGLYVQRFSAGKFKNRRNLAIYR